MDEDHIWSFSDNLTTMETIRLPDQAQSSRYGLWTSRIHVERLAAGSAGFCVPGRGLRRENLWESPGSELVSPVRRTPNSRQVRSFGTHQSAACRRAHVPITFDQLSKLRLPPIDRESWPLFKVVHIPTKPLLPDGRRHVPGSLSHPFLHDQELYLDHRVFMPAHCPSSLLCCLIATC